MTEDLDVLIDRVVDGGLSPAGLRESLGCIAAEPDGWRLCTLAFLEAQGLDEVLREHAPASLPIPVASPSRGSFVRPALAATIALACFASGWLAARRLQPAAPVLPAVAVAPAPPVGAPPDPSPSLSPRPVLPVPAWVLNQPPPVSADAEAAMRARGYRLDQQRRILATRLPDGRRVVVPVDRVGVRYVGGLSL